MFTSSLDSNENTGTNIFQTSSATIEIYKGLLVNLVF